MSRVTIVLLIIAVILVGVLIALYFIGKRLQARQEQSDEQIQAMKQPMTLLVIDKKRLKLKESGLPDQVIQQTPWYAKRSKVPVVKAKVGPQFINFIQEADQSHGKRHLYRGGQGHPRPPQHRYCSQEKELGRKASGEGRCQACKII